MNTMQVLVLMIFACIIIIGLRLYFRIQEVKREQKAKQRVYREHVNRTKYTTVKRTK